MEVPGSECSTLFRAGRSAVAPDVEAGAVGKVGDCADSGVAGEPVEERDAEDPTHRRADRPVGLDHLVGLVGASIGVGIGVGTGLGTGVRGSANASWVGGVANVGARSNNGSSIEVHDDLRLGAWPRAGVGEVRACELEQRGCVGCRLVPFIQVVRGGGEGPLEDFHLVARDAEAAGAMPCSVVVEREVHAEPRIAFGIVERVLLCVAILDVAQVRACRLELGSGRMQRDGEQVRLVGGLADTSKCPDLGVGQGPSSELGTNQGHVDESSSGPDVITGRVHREPALEAEPVGHRPAFPVLPCATPVVLGDEEQESTRSSREMCRRRHELGFETFRRQ